jgi:hypothetical protein
MAQTAVEMFAECLRLRHKSVYDDMQEDIEAYYMKIEKEQLKLADENGSLRKQYQHDLEYGGAEYWETEPQDFENYYNETFNK